MEWRESQVLELKASLAQRDDGLKTLCGMVNAEPAKGTVVFGIASDGKILGLQGDLDRAQQGLAQVIRQKFSPSLQVRMEIREIEGKPVLHLEGTRERATCYHEFDGRAYIREGTATRQLTLDEKDRLRKMRDRDAHNGPWKCSGCGAIAMMLAGIRVTDKGVQKSYSCSDCGGEFWPV